ncbi:MAG: UDP-N-acetylmuramoyl-tripeptide--D-alanyl-D-alanine ligase [bacterium]|nr:UDP-N-acetylmuramoyl-tripeptide--D-alanyl-D-alanine ligase [bacterium]
MRKYIAKILIWQTTRLLDKWKPVVIVVAGSVGKTSTTQAIAEVLSETKRVRATRHNYNSDVGVPCSVFGYDLPSTLANPFAWLAIYIKNEFILLGDPAFDTLVLELGTDKPGEIAEFSYLKPHIAVVTAVAPEHMENFGSLDAVAHEELKVAQYSEETVCNREMVDAKYVQGLDVLWYDSSILKNYKTEPKSLGRQGKQIASAAAWVGERVGIGKEATDLGLARLGPQPGRMQLLPGINKSVLIDDTYNSSPEANIAALDFLYEGKAPARIALLGNMNELGAYSEEAHSKVGEYCDPNKIDVVLTLGTDANKYLAESAESKGCRVIRTATPYQASDVIREELKRINKPGVIILCKGSQNGVFAEEAVKNLLANKTDSSKLVRQSDAWLRKKSKSFASLSRNR